MRTTDSMLRAGLGHEWIESDSFQRLKQEVWMERIPIVEKLITSANLLSVEVGTNCPQGGDSGHGGRTFFRLTDLCSTDLRVRQPDGKLAHVESVEIVLGCDSECRTFVEALEFAAASLRAMQAAATQSAEHVLLD
jgi:hypothetical protein